jgi:large subunit ribosomal protein L9
MQIILLKDVEKLGLRGDVVDVARGYARNYLLPRRLAEVATPARVAESRRVDEQRARHEARSAEQAHDIAEILNKTVLTFEVKSGPTGSLFGSVTPSDVVDEIWRTRKIRVDRRKVETDPIKRIGRYAIPIEVFDDVRVEVKTLVVPEGGELPPEGVLAALEAAEAAEAATAETEAATEHEEAEAAIAEVIAEEEPEVEAETPQAEAAAEAEAAPEAVAAPEADATTEDQAAPEELEPPDEPALTDEPPDEPAADDAA